MNKKTAQLLRTVNIKYISLRQQQKTFFLIGIKFEGY
ncbi:Uncharacterised protein [Chryseobacterium indoltheticum]|uniref:Uncharacterized protein n=1 Tax=Chryseobacterium indoltheticum TaxID=254 RepID=A0A381FRD8_9FLAO|nr:Uncharacterised protein [Chryseobacterium indoltheticum]